MVTTIGCDMCDRRQRYRSLLATAWLESGSRLLREAVEQTIAASGDQVRLAAGARHVRRIPGALEHGVGPAAAIDMPDRGAAEGAARPVVAGEVHVAGPGGAVHLRAGQHVMPVRRHANAGHHCAALGQRILLAKLVVVAVQVLDAGRDHGALEVLPGALADAVASVNRAALVALVRAQISAPSLAAGASRGRELLAVAIRTCEAAEVGAFAGPDAGDEKAHVW